jgi:indolepyruvate decarboxylase
LTTATAVATLGDQMNLAESLLHALADAGVRQLFGIPGDFALPFFGVVERSGILPLHTLSHEPAVGFAADAAARAGGVPGAMAVTWGAGALNAVNAVAAAYAEQVPLVVISGAPGRDEARAGLGLHHQVKTLDSQFLIYREITCDQERLDDVRTAPAAIARVLGQCIHRSRPVYFEFPRDMVLAGCEPAPPPVEPPVIVEAVAECVAEVRARIAAAHSPVVMVDVEVRRHGLESEVAELVRRLDLPVVSCFMGHGLLAGLGSPLLGTYLGIAGDPAITRLVEESDCLLMLGVIPSDTNLGVSEKRLDPRAVILARDRSVRIGHHRFPEVPLRALVEGLLAGLPEPELRPRPLPTLQRAADFIADEATIGPQDIAAAVNLLFRKHGPMPMASDMGDCLLAALDVGHTELVAPGYYATMGYGVPAGLGLQAAMGRRPLVLVGDGAFQMTGWELGNCRRNGWDPIVIVLNNRSWEMLRVFQPESRFNELDDWDFAACAAPLGGEGVRVQTRRELWEALERAVAAPGRFWLIDAAMPRGAVSSTLGRYVAGLKRRR